MQQYPTSPNVGLRRKETVSISDRRGMDFTRAAIARGLAENADEAARIAERRWGNNKAIIELVTKASVPAGSTIAGSHGQPLVSNEGAAGEFFRLVLEKSVVGRMAAVRRVPFNISTLAQYSGTSAGWLGEGQPIPLSNYVVERFPGLDRLKVAGLTVSTRELLREPEAEEFMRADLLRAAVYAVDQAFLDPSNSGVADVKPRSILNGTTESGDDSSPSDISDSFRELIADFAGDLDTAFWVMSPTVAAMLHSSDHTEVGPRGGAYYGIPVITSRNAASGVVALIDASSVALAVGELELDTSQHGSIGMLDNPTNASAPTVVQAQQVSMFTSNSVAFRVVMAANWRLCRVGGVSWFDGVNFSAGATIELHN